LGAGVAVAVASASERGLAAQLAGANRPHYWHVAWKEYTLNPLTGSGAGTFDSYWLHYRPVSSFARDAHSLYVETLAELGPLGLALVVLALAVPSLPSRGPAIRLSPLPGPASVGLVLTRAAAGAWGFPSAPLAGLPAG